MMLSHDDIVMLLSTQGGAYDQLLDRALATKLHYLDNKVHLRGLIEYSSVCTKDCFYCGLRSHNNRALRYTMTDQEVLSCARQAMELHYGSVAIQCGERSDRAFTDSITRLVKAIKALSHGTLGITLSCGEQTDDVYRQWFDAGAHRYLLRIETSNRELYYKIHPHDDNHSFDRRLRCLDSLKKIGYQTGSGVMVGLPFQTVHHLADDLLFFQSSQLAMVGMGPFIPHPDTPLWQYRESIPSVEERVGLTLRMIAVLRIMMPEINMVSATANQTLVPNGRLLAIQAGANVIMPNLSPDTYLDSYSIYPNKHCADETSRCCGSTLDRQLATIGHEILYDEWGDSKAFLEVKKIGEHSNTVDDE